MGVQAEEPPPSSLELALSLEATSFLVRPGEMGRQGCAGQQCSEVCGPGQGLAAVILSWGMFMTHRIQLETNSLLSPMP